MATNISHTLATEGCNMESITRMRQNCKFASNTTSVFLILFLLRADVCYPIDPDMGIEHMCDVNKIADVVLFLCSDSAQVVNGAMWTADAGVTAA